MSIMHNNKFVDVNDAWLQAFGLSREEVINHTPADLNVCISHMQFDKDILELPNQDELYNYELSYVDSNGEERRGLASSETIYVDGADCLLHIMLDITHQKQMEKEIARLERLSLIGEMAASIAHEIRNPMATVRGFIQLLYEEEQYQKDRGHFELMIEEMDRANMIITEYLGMAKNKMVDLKPQHLDEIVRSFYPIMEADAHFMEMSIRLELTESSLVLIDESEIRKLIINMTRNGLESMKPGGVLTVGNMEQDNETVLYIKDQGDGLDPKLLDKLGTPFVTTREKSPGLGLAVCYSIAARHRARITYDTGANGTVFYISFPHVGKQK
jgi:PAS domain S-box-containing protein